ncbi:DUF4169 family protein [Roseovarius sp. MBR-6]|jgi:hypothetical protein|uniref:DUF4169 family protein n=1 Tax=Roseovarius sp. MBR-6 TaxID=3156459 RepID=UPI0033963BDD
MTDGPVNLNRVRKQRARAERQARADENAARFGRTKAQKKLEEAEADKARRTLDQHRREED